MHQHFCIPWVNATLNFLSLPNLLSALLRKHGVAAPYLKKLRSAAFPCIFATTVSLLKRFSAILNIHWALVWLSRVRNRKKTRVLSSRGSRFSGWRKFVSWDEGEGQSVMQVSPINKCPRTCCPWVFITRVPLQSQTCPRLEAKLCSYPSCWVRTHTHTHTHTQPSAKLTELSLQICLPKQSWTGCTLRFCGKERKELDSDPSSEVTRRKGNGREEASRHLFATSCVTARHGE